MIGLALMAAAVATPPPPETGSWLAIAVHRVIAPAHIPGQCFVQGQVRQVISGPVFQVGDALAITVNCVEVAAGGKAGARPPPTIRALRSHKDAVVHLDAGSRVIGNAFYGTGAATPAAPL